MQSSITHDSSTSIFDKKKIAFLQLAFFLLFPGFFFYQTLLGIGAISAFLGGYFGIVSLAIMLPTISFYLIDLKIGRTNFSKIDLYFSIFITYFISIVAINYISDANITIIRTHLLSIIYLINIFIIFKTINPGEKRFQIIAIVCLLLMSLIIFYLSVDGSFYLASLEESKNPESVATYQGFARSYLLTFVAIISFTKKTSTRALIYSIAMPSLFLNSARSELVALIFLIPIIEIYYAKHKLHATLGIIAIVAIIGLSFEQILQILPNNRVLELTDLSHSSSANLRHYLTTQAINTINGNIFLGDYASYIPGDYSHNILSAWVDLGLFGFIYLLTILLLPALGLFLNGFFLKTKSSDCLLACSLISITLLFLFTSKTFDDMFVGAALGAYAKYKSGKIYG